MTKLYACTHCKKLFTFEELAKGEMGTCVDCMPIVEAAFNEWLDAHEKYPGQRICVHHNKPFDNCCDRPA